MFGLVSSGMAIDTSFLNDKDVSYPYLVKRSVRFHSKSKSRIKKYRRVSNPKFNSMASLVVGIAASSFALSKAKKILKNL